MIVYLRRRPLLLCSVVHTNIPLRLPRRNVIRKSSIHRRSVVASVPLLPAKAREGAGAWLLLRRCTMAAVVPLVSAKARKGAGAWLLLRRQCCTLAAAVVSHERFRTITMTTTVLQRRPRDIIACAAAAATVVLRWGGKGWHVGIYAIALEEAIAAQMPKLTRGVAESVEPPWWRPRDIIAGAAAATAV